MLTEKQKRIIAEYDNPGHKQALTEAFERDNAARKYRNQVMKREGAYKCGECNVLASYSYPCPCRGRC